MSKYSVKKPYTVFVGVILVIILGFVSFTSMSTDLLPSMELPYIAIMTVSPGNSPEKIETSITKPLEQQLATTSGIKEVQSISSENMSIIILEFYDDTNMDSTMIDISAKIDLANLDDDVANPTIMQINPDMMPIYVGSIDMDKKDIKELSTIASDEIIPELEKVDGVASVTTTGIIENSVSITLDQQKIEELNTQILQKVDETLAENKAKLDNASSQLAQAKSQLRQQESNANNQMVSGEIQLTQAKSSLQITIQSLDIAISTAQTTIENFEKYNDQYQIPEEAYVAAKQSLESAVAKRQELQTQLDTLNSQSSTLTSSQQMMSQKISEAYGQIEKGEAELIVAQATFNSASQQAYKTAGLTSALDKTTIAQLLTAQSFSMPAGYLDYDHVSTLVKVGDEFKNIDEIKNLVLVDQGGMTIKLSDVATIQQIDNAGDNYAKINGNDGLLISIQKVSTASTADISDALNDQIETLENKYDGLHITSLQDQGSYIDIIVGSVLNNLVSGGILAAIILFIFLKDMKTTLITAISIPISVMFAIVLMYFSGVSLNIISLSGLALGVGMLVDNSIVVLENIYRLKVEGEDIYDACVTGAKQMAGAITASTLTTVCVFLPIVFTEGLTKQLFTDMGLTIGYSLVASLIVALTLVPALSSKLLKNSKQKEQKLFNKIVDGYASLLDKVLNKKAILLAVVTGLFVCSCYMITSMGTAFIPDMDSENISVTLSGEPTLTEDEFIEKIEKVSDQIEKIEGVKTVGVMKGGTMLSSMSGSQGNSMSAYVVLDEKRSSTSQDIAAKINKIKESDLEVSASGSSMDMSALTGNGVKIVVKGDDLNKLMEISHDIKGILEGVEGLKEETDGQENNDQQILLTVDKNKAIQYQLTVAQVYADVASYLKTSVSSIDIADEDGVTYPINIVDEKTNISLDDLKNHVIKTESGEVKVSDICTITNQAALKSINHDNQVRTMTVSASIDDGYNVGLVSRDVNKALEKYDVPNGYSIEMDGENETINSAMIDLVKMIALAIVFIYLIMIAQFQSLRSPFIVLFTLPLAFTGGLFALIITNSELSMIAMLGFLILSGIVVNNGIVFVDTVNQLKEEGYSQREALITTGQLRIRPILMTALTTILGLSTMAMGIGSGADMLAPMAIVTIGGLAYSTLLTLFVVPAIYDIVNHEKKHKKRKLFKYIIN